METRRGSKRLKEFVIYQINCEQEQGDEPCTRLEEKSGKSEIEEVRESNQQ